MENLFSEKQKKRREEKQLEEKFFVLFGTKLVIAFNASRRDQAALRLEKNFTNL